MPGEVVLQVLHQVWQALASLSVPAAVMGGLAVSAWKHIRATHDVDLLVTIDESRLPEILTALHSHHIHHRSTPPVLALGAMRLLPLSYRLQEFGVDVRIDLVLATSPFEQSALNRALETEEFNGGIRVVRCEDLVLFKLMAGRIIDRADTAFLLRLNRDSLDLPYLKHWAAQLSLAHELDAVWGEAFPGENIPT
jgi:hypothetical protein